MSIITSHKPLHKQSCLLLLILKPLLVNPSHKMSPDKALNPDSCSSYNFDESQPLTPNHGCLEKRLQPPCGLVVKFGDVIVLHTQDKVGLICNLLSLHISLCPLVQFLDSLLFPSLVVYFPEVYRVLI